MRTTIANFKIKYLGIVLLSIVFLSKSFSNNVNLDSKKKVYFFAEAHTQKDTSKVTLIKTLLADVKKKNEIGDFGDANIKLLDSAKSLFLQLKKPETELIADLYLSFNNYYDYNYKIDEQIKNNEEFIELYTKRKDKEIQKLLLAYSELGSAYCEKNEHVNSLNRVVRKSQPILDSIFQFSNDKKVLNQARLGQVSNYRLQSINALYLSDGKILREAIEGFDKIIKYRDQLDNSDMLLSFALANIGDACLQTGEFEKAKRYIGYWEDLIPEEDAYQNLVATALKFSLLNKQGLTNNAKITVEKAEKYYNTIPKGNPYKEDFYYPILYYYYLDKVENDSISKKEFDIIIKDFFAASSSKFENHQLIKIYAYDLLITNDFKNKNFSNTIDYLDKQLLIANKFIRQRFILKNRLNRLRLATINKDCESIETIITDFLEENNIDDLNSIQLNNKTFLQNISGTLYTADSAIKFSNELVTAIEDNDLLCETNFKAAHKLAEYASILVEQNKSKLYFNVKQEELITDINSTLLKLRSLAEQNEYQFNDKVLLNLLEQNVTSQLTIKNNLNSIKFSYPKSVQKVFDSIQLNDLKITELKTNLKNLTGDIQNKTQKNIDDLYKKKDDLYTNLSSLNCDKCIENITGFKFENIENTLLDDEWVIRFYNFNNVYAFAIRKNEIRFFNMGDHTDISKYISGYIKKIRNIESFDAEGTILKQRFQPILSLAKQQQKFKIIPSGTLALVPFELLFETYNQKEISVNYNTSLQNLNLRNDITVNANLVSFSPQYQTSSNKYSAYRDGMFSLPYAQEEASYVTQLFNGDLFALKEANKEAFVKNSSSYNMIHMAMHAMVDENNELNSKLIFGEKEEANLTLNDIYNLKLNADLVTLSACNTGYGKIDPIEGVLSLSRAFQYAGASTTVTSLWRVPDKETSLIMKFFYENLKEGETKGNALANAKKQYISTVSDENLKHPYYWSGFILTGNPDTSFITKNGLNYYYALAGILFLVLLFYFRKTKLK